MLNRQQLAQLISDVAVLTGQFTLRSGRTSHYYVDKYRFSTHPEALVAVADHFADRIRAYEAETGETVDRLAGAELGGIPLVAATGIALGKPTIFVRNAKKEYGTAKQIEGVLNPSERVVFLEDVATTGGQAIEAVEDLRALGADVSVIMAVIDRQEGAREAIESKGLRFEALFTTSDLDIPPAP